MQGEASEATNFYAASIRKRIAQRINNHLNRKL